METVLQPPAVHKQHKKPGKFPLFPFVLIILMLIGRLVWQQLKPEPVGATKKRAGFDDFVQRKEDGTYELKPERDIKRERGLERLRDEAEQYVLKAETDGYYPCVHCPNKRFFLLRGEIAKVGVTVRGQLRRYNKSFYANHGLRYVMEYRGSIQEALEREFVRIVNYPLTEENIIRPDTPTSGLERYKIARPPLNAVDR